METQEVKDSKNESLVDIAKAFEGIFMRELIGAPLLAAAEAQEKLASTAWDYLQRIAYNTDVNGKPPQDTRILSFDLERPVEKNGAMTTLKQTVQAPFIGLVPIPSLLIDHVDVTTTNTEVSKTESEVNSSISSK